METKICSICKIAKSFSEFHKDTRPSNKSKLKAACKECRKTISKTYRAKPEVRIKEQKQKREYHSRPEIKAKTKEREKRRYQEKMKDPTYREKVNQLAREERKTLKHKVHMQIYRRQNAGKRKQNNKIWISKNLDKYRERNREHSRQLRLNPIYRVGQSISKGIRTSVKTNKAGRHWEDIVGYTLSQLKTRLESLFKPGMSWDNHSQYGWHMDHIRPINSFDFSKNWEATVREAWALNNLQPLWWHENLSKGAKIVDAPSLSQNASNNLSRTHIAK